MSETSLLLPTASTPSSYGSVSSSRLMTTPQGTSTQPTTFPPHPLPSSSDSPAPLPPSPPRTASNLRRRNGKASVEQGEQGRGKGRWSLPRIAFELENKGSVARDHLASEWVIRAVKLGAGLSGRGDSALTHEIRFLGSQENFPRLVEDFPGSG